MCLILVAWCAHPAFPLVVAANRDEFYARPTALAARWPASPKIIGGRDLEAGGTWLGVSEQGRFAAVTNLLLSDGESLHYASNRGPQAQSLAPGVYGLSNHLLDSPWPKLIAARQRFSEALQSLPASQAFFDILRDDEIVPDDQLPNTGVPLEWERRLSAIFVRSPEYGTRASTLVAVNAQKTPFFEERSFGPNGQPLQSSVISTGV